MERRNAISVLTKGVRDNTFFLPRIGSAPGAQASRLSVDYPSARQS